LLTLPGQRDAAVQLPHCCRSWTAALLGAAGFEGVKIEDTGAKYLAGYRRAMELAAQGALPAFGTHILMGQTAPEKTRNAARNIKESQTHPVQIICFRPL
jgi:hypothetical protein